MDIIITEEQRLKVCEYLTNLLLVFRGAEVVSSSNSPPKPSEPEGDEVWQTFDEWSQQGFRIIKGERATRIDGKHKFSNKQVREYKPIPRERPTQHEFDPMADEDVPF